MTLSSEIQQLKELWTELFPAITTPEDSQWALWFLKHGGPIVRNGIVELAVKYHKIGDQMNWVYMGKFASAVMNRLSRECEHKKTLEEIAERSEA